MINLTFKIIEEVLGSPCITTLASEINFFEGISIDTRTLEPHNLFIAIQGENFDGHDFVNQAIEKKAAAIIVNRKLDVPIPQFVVNDTTEALGKLAGYWRDQCEVFIIGLTGSNGKTTLKNMIASILRAAYGINHVLATEGNLNNNIGLPLMLARLNKQHQFAVFEMGMNHFGEIHYLTQLAKPNIAIITNAAESHLEGLGSIAGVAKAKGEIFSGLQKEGVAILNKDDPHFDYWKNLIGQHHYITFGLNSKADVTASIQNEKITIHTPQGEINLTLPFLGKHNIINALAATSSVLSVKINLEYIKLGLENAKPAPGRMRLYSTLQEARLIDDTYNANPFSTRAAIQALSSFSGEKILVLGDMKELGEDARQLHFQTGQWAQEAGIDRLFTLGQLTEATQEGFGKGGTHFVDKEQLFAALTPLLNKNTTLLIKGSRSMHMDDLVKKLVSTEQLDPIH